MEKAATNHRQYRKRRYSGSRSEESGGRERNGHERKEDDDNETFCQLYIAKISRKCTSDHLRDQFSPYGAITDVQMKGNYAFITYESHNSAVTAIDAMNNKEF
jgi:RNA recognition motif-containing protein